eukprot:5676671-Prorocentrum_lima.AAC.1
MQAKIEEVCKGGGQARGEGLAGVTAETVWAWSPSRRKVRKEGGDLRVSKGNNVCAGDKSL